MYGGKKKGEGREQCDGRGGTEVSLVVGLKRDVIGECAMLSDLLF